MDCVDKTRFTCICGCNMTTSTVIFGVVFILGGIGGTGGLGGIGLMGYLQMIMGCFMLSVCCYPKSIAVRRLIYKTYVVYCIALIVVFIIVIILILAVDDLTSDGTDRLKNYYDNHLTVYSEYDTSEYGRC